MKLLRRIRPSIRRLQNEHWLYLLSYALLLCFGLLLVGRKNPTVVAVGASIVATAVAGWVLFLRVWLSHDRTYILEMKNKFGLLRVFEQRAIPIRDEYESRLQIAEESIDILGFGLQSLRQDYHLHFSEWAARARVRILLLDPEFPAPEYSVASQRDEEEGDDRGTIAKEVRRFVDACADLLRTSQRFEVRLYRCLPMVNIFRIDRSLFWGPYLLLEVSRNCPTLLTQEGGILFDKLSAHFEQIWQSDVYSRPVPQDWLPADDESD